MKYLDYLFWYYYTYFTRREKRHPKLFFGDHVFEAISIIVVSILIPLVNLYALLDAGGILDLPNMPEKNQRVCLLPWRFGGHCIGFLIIGIIKIKKSPKTNTNFLEIDGVKTHNTTRKGA